MRDKRIPCLDYSISTWLYKMLVILAVLLVVGRPETVQQIFGRLQGSGNWGEGTSSQVCYNMDYLMRLQHTIDLQDVKEIVEIGFGDWSITGLMHL